MKSVLDSAHGYGAASLPLLGKGYTESGPHVDSWRAFLNGLGNPKYAVAATGAWDFTLDNATRDFQGDHGAGVDGIVGPETRGLMDAIGTPTEDGTIAPIAMEAVEVTTKAVKSAAAATTTFLDTPLWSDGPTRGKAIGAAGLLAGAIIGSITLKNMLTAPAAGYAAQDPRYGDCGCH